MPFNFIKCPLAVVLREVEKQCTIFLLYTVHYFLCLYQVSSQNTCSILNPFLNESLCMLLINSFPWEAETSSLTSVLCLKQLGSY